MDGWLITYDVPDDKRRAKLADALLDYGRRVQWSVFEVWLDAALKRELRSRIEAIIDAQEDSVRIYALCARCWDQVEVMGRGDSPAAPSAIIL